MTDSRQSTGLSKRIGCGLVVANENQPKEVVPLRSWHGGEELVNIANREELYRAIEGG